VDLELHPSVVREVNETLERREKSVGAETYTRVTETSLRYEIAIGMEPQSGELFVLDERLSALKRDGRLKTSRKPFIELEHAPDGSRRFVARIERQSHPRYFDAHRPRSLLSELSDPVYHPHVVAAAREISSWRVYYVEPTSMRAEVPVQGADDPGRSGELLAAYYYQLQRRHPFAFGSVQRSLGSVVAGLERLRVDVREGLLEIVAIQRGGAEFPARLLSEGTLRLLCVLGLAVAPRPPAVVVYEEPENGVNPARLDRIASILRSAVETREDASQFILTTHSPLLCRLLSDALLACAWTADGGTRFEPFDVDIDNLYFESELAQRLDELTREARVEQRSAP
jgi:predicted ATPase